MRKGAGRWVEESKRGLLVSGRRRQLQQQLACIGATGWRTAYPGRVTDGAGTRVKKETT